MLIIKFTNFADGVHTLEFNEPVKNVGLDTRYKGSANLLVEMDKSHSQIVLKCSINISGDFECDRCGEIYESALNNHFRLTYLIDRQSEKSESLNLYYLSPETDKIDLKNDVKEFIILTEPMKKLCKDDCKGLCYKCGTNLNYYQCDCKEETKNYVFSSLNIKKKKSNQK
jgi:uncharacterized protein